MREAWVLMLGFLVSVHSISAAELNIHPQITMTLPDAEPRPEGLLQGVGPGFGYLHDHCQEAMAHMCPGFVGIMCPACAQHFWVSLEPICNNMDIVHAVCYPKPTSAPTPIPTDSPTTIVPTKSPTIDPFPPTPAASSSVELYDRVGQEYKMTYSDDAETTLELVIKPTLSPSPAPTKFPTLAPTLPPTKSEYTPVVDDETYVTNAANSVTPCTPGQQIPLIWKDSNITNNDNIDEVMLLRGSKFVHGVRMGTAFAANLQGRINLGHSGPWQIEFELVNPIHQYHTMLGSTTMDYIQVKVGNTAEKVAHNHVPASGTIMKYEVHQDFFHYNFNWESNIGSEENHMELMNGVATCIYTLPPSPAPTPEYLHGQCSHTRCEHNEDGKIQIFHHKSEKKGDKVSCGHFKFRLHFEHAVYDDPGCHCYCAFDEKDLPSVDTDILGDAAPHEDQPFEEDEAAP